MGRPGSVRGWDGGEEARLLHLGPCRIPHGAHTLRHNLDRKIRCHAMGEKMRDELVRVALTFFVNPFGKSEFVDPAAVGLPIPIVAAHGFHAPA